MNYYDVYVKNHYSGEPEPIRICSHSKLAPSVLNSFQYMTYEEAASYCRAVLRAAIMRGHPQSNES